MSQLTIQFRDVDVIVDIISYTKVDAKLFGLPEDCSPEELELEFEVSYDNSEFIVDAFEALPQWYYELEQLVLAELED